VSPTWRQSRTRRDVASGMTSLMHAKNKTSNLFTGHCSLRQTYCGRRRVRWNTIVGCSTARGTRALQSKLLECARAVNADIHNRTKCANNALLWTSAVRKARNTPSEGLNTTADSAAFGGTQAFLSTEYASIFIHTNVKYFGLWKNVAPVNDVFITG
jgi:hypothetical protein